MVTLVTFESLAVITILPDISDDLGGIAWYGWVSTAFFLGTMVGIVFAGEQADRHGAGRPYAWQGRAGMKAKDHGTGLVFAYLPSLSTRESFGVN